jgi:HSP20 family protein
MEVAMSEVRVTKKKAVANRKESLPEFFTPIASFVTIPLDLMRGVMEGIDHTLGITPGAKPGCWTPAINFEQCQGHLVVTAELPGLKKDEVKVELTDGSLVIKGEHNREHKTHHEGLHKFERRYGQFYRSIPLPTGAKLDQVKAELHDGVLKISMPVAEKKVHQVPVDKPAAA